MRYVFAGAGTMPTPDPPQPNGWLAWVLWLGGPITGAAALLKVWFSSRTADKKLTLDADGEKRHELTEQDRTLWSRMESDIKRASEWAARAEQRADRAEQRADQNEGRLSLLEARVTELETELEAARSLLAQRDGEILKLKSEIERLVGLTVEHGQAYQAQELHYTRLLEEDRQLLETAEQDRETLRERIRALEEERNEVQSRAVE